MKLKEFVDFREQPSSVFRKLRNALAQENETELELKYSDLTKYRVRYDRNNDIEIRVRVWGRRGDFKVDLDVITIQADGNLSGYTYDAIDRLEDWDSPPISEINAKDFMDGHWKNIKNLL